MALPAALTFIVVEDRENRTLALCRESARRAVEELRVISDIDAGPDFQRLRTTYLHLSSNTPEFELVCLRRYFLLARWLEVHPECREFVLVDSDVLLQRGVGAHIRQLAAGTDFCGSSMHAGEDWARCEISPHVSYWSAAGLSSFVAYVLGTYDSPLGRARLQAIAARFAARGERGGVSDMTLLYLWAEETGNTAPINRISNGRVIDHNINSASNRVAAEFRMRGGAKRLSYVHGRALLTTAAGVPVEAMALHFQGRSKLGMPLALAHRALALAMLTAALLVLRRLRNAVYRLGMARRRPGAAGRVAQGGDAE